MEKSYLKKVYKVWVNGAKKEMTYEAICKVLEFNAECEFVRITTAGTIGFWCGTPQDIKSLYRKCQLQGFKIAKSLDKAYHCC